MKAEHITRTSLLAKFSLSHLQEVARVLTSYNLHSSDSPLETLPSGDKKEGMVFSPSIWQCWPLAQELIPGTFEFEAITSSKPSQRDTLFQTLSLDPSLNLSPVTLPGCRDFPVSSSLWIGQVGMTACVWLPYHIHARCSTGPDWLRGQTLYPLWLPQSSHPGISGNWKQIPLVT